MKNTLLLAACFAATVFLSCSKSPSESASCTGADTFQLANPFNLCYGSTAEQSDAPGFLSVRFYSLVEDSRCPSDVICIRAGSVSVGLQFDLHDATFSDTLVLGDSFTGFNTVDSTLFSGYKIRLLKVDPYPSQAAGDIPDEAYKVRLEITK